MTVPPAPIAQAGVDASTLVWGLLTQLGDSWLLGLLALSLYWLGPRAPIVGARNARERLIVVVAAFLLAIALTGGLKAWFGAPRPGGVLAPTVPEPTVDSVVAWLTGASGHGFPSGHGVAATAVWGGLAWAVRTGSARARIAFVAVLVGVVGLSRVALGVHTPVQMIAGVGIGLAVLVAVLSLATPVHAFALAAVAGVVATVAVGPIPDVLLATGLAVGGAVAWIRWGAVIARSTTGGRAAFALGAATVLPVLGGLVAVQHGSVLAPAVVVLVAIGGGVALVALPLAGEAVAKKLGSRTDRRT